MSKYHNSASAVPSAQEAPTLTTFLCYFLVFEKTFKNKEGKKQKNNEKI